ncbi:MAG: YaeQ family protein [Acidobacteriota bacterium]|nr:YaeQ family protein [Acidobacteriota bacterium]
MAQAATVYTFATELADVDRGVYETLSVRMARHASETPGFMLTRLLAYCLEYAEGIAFTEGVAAGDEPAVLVRDLTGRITAWIEVGMPDAERVHRGSRHASRVAIYTHRSVPHVLAQLDGRRVFRAGHIPVFAFGEGFVDEAAERLDRRAAVAVSVTERQLYLDVDGHTFATEIAEHHFG